MSRGAPRQNRVHRSTCTYASWCRHLIWGVRRKIFCAIWIGSFFSLCFRRGGYFRGWGVCRFRNRKDTGASCDLTLRYIHIHKLRIRKSVWGTCVNYRRMRSQPHTLLFSGKCCYSKDIFSAKIVQMWLKHQTVHKVRLRCTFWNVIETHLISFQYGRFFSRWPPKFRKMLFEGCFSTKIVQIWLKAPNFSQSCLPTYLLKCVDPFDIF